MGPVHRHGARERPVPGWPGASHGAAPRAARGSMPGRTFRFLAEGDGGSRPAARGRCDGEQETAEAAVDREARGRIRKAVRARPSPMAGQSEAEADRSGEGRAEEQGEGPPGRRERPRKAPASTPAAAGANATPVASGPGRTTSGIPAKPPGAAAQPTLPMGSPRIGRAIRTTSVGAGTVTARVFATGLRRRASPRRGGGGAQGPGDRPSRRAGSRAAGGRGSARAGRSTAGH